MKIKQFLWRIWRLNLSSFFDGVKILLLIPSKKDESMGLRVSRKRIMKKNWYGSFLNRAEKVLGAWWTPFELCITKKLGIYDGERVKGTSWREMKRKNRGYLFVWREFCPLFPFFSCWVFMWSGWKFAFYQPFHAVFISPLIICEPFSLPRAWSKPQRKHFRRKNCLWAFFLLKSTENNPWEWSSAGWWMEPIKSHFWAFGGHLNELQKHCGRRTKTNDDDLWFVRISRLCN